ncbi:MAG: methyl-accepting chemotaxis protein, partial [Oscillospiraceae bacterium]
DIKVTTICDMVANAKSTYKQGYRILISNEGYILAHKNQDDILKKYDEIGLDKTLLDGINKVADKVVNFKDSGSDAYAVIGQENSSGWKIVNIIPSAEYKKSTNAVGLTIIIINVIAIILIISIMYIIAKSISNPLKNLTKTTDKLAAGDLDVSIDVRSKDEVGKLAQSMSVLVNRLKDYIAYINEISDLLEQIGNGNLNLTFVQSYDGDFKKVKDALIHSSDMLSYTLSECNVAAGQVTSGSEQVAVGAQALSQGATEQASSIEELSSTMEDISNKIKENAVKSNQASKYSNEAAQEVILSNQKMKEMSQAMADITEKSNEIGKIIKTIDDIAFQTNILALNAAVEAARAGVAGKGFAVVADEVRNLAAKSAEAAQNTTSLIEGAIEAVARGGKITTETAKALSVVKDKTTKVAELIDEISKASNEQATGVAQVTLGIEQISSVVQTNSATAEESAAASEELTGQSNMMREMLSQFRIRDNIRNLEGSSKKVENDNSKGKNTTQNNVNNKY